MKSYDYTVEGLYEMDVPDDHYINCILKFYLMNMERFWIEPSVRRLTKLLDAYERVLEVE